VKVIATPAATAVELPTKLDLMSLRITPLATSAFEVRPAEELVPSAG